MRSPEEIFAEIAATLPGEHYYQRVAQLWRELARAADRDKAPGWATCAAALVADNYERQAAWEQPDDH